MRRAARECLCCPRGDRCWTSGTDTGICIGIGIALCSLGLGLGLGSCGLLAGILGLRCLGRLRHLRGLGLGLGLLKGVGRHID
jgi:hypothetical protein